MREVIKMNAISVTQQINAIKRITNPPHLLEVGVLVEKIDREIPDVQECMSRILRPQMYPENWRQLVSGVPVKREKPKTIVTFTTVKALATFNCMIANVRTPQEMTIRIETLYTDDPEFSGSMLPPITKEEEYAKIEQGKICYINPECTYVVKILSQERLNGITERVTDIVFYVPEESLYMR